MKKHGVMLFTFVVLFLTLGCDLAYGQGEEGNEKEEVIVTLNFSEKAQVQHRTAIPSTGVA